MEAWIRNPFFIVPDQCEWECAHCVWSLENCTEFHLSRQGNSCQLLECSCENKQRAGSSLHLAAFPPLTSPFQPSPLEPFKHLTVSAGPSGEVNQRNVSSRLEALNPGPESAIFQLLGKNMCSRNSYKILSKSATALTNHTSLVTALKDFLNLGPLGSATLHLSHVNVIVLVSTWLEPCKKQNFRCCFEFLSAFGGWFNHAEDLLCCSPNINFS